MMNQSSTERDLAIENGKLRRRARDRNVWIAFFAILAGLFLMQIVIKNYFHFDIFAGGYCPTEICSN